MRILVSSDPALSCARHIASVLKSALEVRNVASMAVSGGTTSPPLFEALTTAAVGGKIDWGHVGVWQVDERIAPDGDDDRNAGQLHSLPAVLHPMPVTGDVAAQLARYEANLPDVFDVVHLGVGGDGHTASWPPAPHPDAAAALASADPVLTIGEFNGCERMALGVGVVNAARERVVLATGDAKAHVIAAWVAGSEERGAAWIDAELPIAAVDPVGTTMFLDAAAAAELDDSVYEVVDI